MEEGPRKGVAKHRFSSLKLSGKPRSGSFTLHAVEKKELRFQHLHKF